MEGKGQEEGEIKRYVLSTRSVIISYTAFCFL